jgi:hypothetical protein
MKKIDFWISFSVFILRLYFPLGIFASTGPLGSFGLTQFFRAGAGSGLSRSPARAHKSLEASPCCSGFLFECAIASLGFYHQRSSGILSSSRIHPLVRHLSFSSHSPELDCCAPPGLGRGYFSFYRA